MMVDTLYIVIPCYNEEEVLLETAKRLKRKMLKLIRDKKINNDSKILFINDGSKDKTWKIIKYLNKKNDIYTGISLSRNEGHQNALYAGLMVAVNYADMIISMDADLQDDIEAIDKMIDKYYGGCDIVYGVRSSRKKDTLFKRWSAQFFYKFMNVLGVEIVYNHADYRLTSKRVIRELRNFEEVNLFLRGIFPLIGFKSGIVYYERNERFAGQSKYSLKKMFSFALDGRDRPLGQPYFFAPVGCQRRDRRPGALRRRRCNLDLLSQPSAPLVRLGGNGGVFAAVQRQYRTKRRYNKNRAGGRWD